MIQYFWYSSCKDTENIILIPNISINKKLLQLKLSLRLCLLYISLLGVWFVYFHLFICVSDHLSIGIPSLTYLRQLLKRVYSIPFCSVCYDTGQVVYFMIFWCYKWDLIKNLALLCTASSLFPFPGWITFLPMLFIFFDILISLFFATLLSPRF